MRRLGEKASARILIIDDNRAIHADFRKSLALESDPQVAELAMTEAVLFGGALSEAVGGCQVELDSAYQGREGWELLRKAQDEGRPYALAFVDVRMPPGWDGVQTIARLWEEDAELQTVICTAYSDYSWKQVVERLGQTDRLLILKKPFDPLEVRQLACALTSRWRLTRQTRTRMAALESLIGERNGSNGSGAAAAGGGDCRRNGGTTR